MDRSQEIIRTSWIGIIANVLLAGFKACSHRDGCRQQPERCAVERHHHRWHQTLPASSRQEASLRLRAHRVFQCHHHCRHRTLGRYHLAHRVGEENFRPNGALVHDNHTHRYRGGHCGEAYYALFDAVITLATLVSAGVMLLWGVSLDGILGALISIVIIKAGIEMLASPVNELLGTSISAELTKQIIKEVSDFEGVHGVFDLILHNYGPDIMIGSLHINVYDTMSAHEIHGLTRKITMQMIERHGIIMTVGVYAIATGENRRAELQSKVMQGLAAHKDIVQVHGFYYSEKDNMLSVDVVPDISVHDDAAFVSQLTSEIQPLVPDMQVVIVVDHNYSE